MRIFKIIFSQYLWLLVILLIGLGVRLYKIDNPVADWHSWRQADTAAVARNFYQEGFNPFIPKYDDMSGVAQDPIPNPNRYRFVEFPIYNTLVYVTYLINGGVDERLARLVSVVMSLGSTIFLFLIVRRYWGVKSALLSALLFAVLPFNIFFSRTILPEPTLVFFCLGMFYFVDRWIFENTGRMYLGSVLFTASAFLIKPFAIFYLLPLLYSYHQKEKRWWPPPKRYWLWLIPSLLPFLGWRLWMSQFPQGIPASSWLLNGDGIRFKPSFWKWIIGDRFGREILTVAGSSLLFVGLLVKSTVSESKLLHWWAASLFLFLIVFATGNVRHDYYQTFIIPTLVIFVARGFVLLIKGVDSFLPRIWTVPVAFLFLFLTIYLGWLEVKGLYQVNNWPMVEAGKVADRILPKEAVVVAPYNGDTAFLYQINRPGWPVVAYPIKDLVDQFGVQYYISVSFDAKTKWVMRKYTVLVETPRFVIVDLTKEHPDLDQQYESEPM